MERRRCCLPVAWFWHLASLYFAQACNRIHAINDSADCRLIDIPPASDEDDIRLLGIFHEPRDRVSGLGCLYSRGKQHEVICCRITLYIWFASAMVGLGLGGYFVLHGHEKLKEWMIMVGSYSGEEECSPSFLTRWYAGFIWLGCLFGLPFMYFAVKTVHLLYLESLEYLTVSNWVLAIGCYSLV
eukprot:scaffold11292_cov118-Skeletonema_marinoi.AAC.3